VNRESWKIFRITSFHSASWTKGFQKRVESRLQSVKSFEIFEVVLPRELYGLGRKQVKMNGWVFV